MLCFLVFATAMRGSGLHTCVWYDEGQVGHVHTVALLDFPIAVLLWWPVRAVIGTPPGEFPDKRWCGSSEDSRSSILFIINHHHHYHLL